MGDQKINTPLPPVDWDLPDFSEDSDHPLKSFHDDHVGARHKADEAARLRQSDDRGVMEHPRDILQQHTKIEEAGPFRPAQDDETQRRLRLLEKGQEAASEAPVQQKRGLRDQPGADTTEHLSKVEQRLWSVMDALWALGDEIERLADPRPGILDRQAYLAARAAKLELQIKHQMQLLLSGGVGLTLLADPRLTFKRLFDRIRRWPRRVRPGFRPETDADFDVFLSWVFEPPAAPQGAQEEISAW